MKKMLSLLLASAMSLSLLAGCGGAPQTPPARRLPRPEHPRPRDPQVHQGGRPVLRL